MKRHLRRITAFFLSAMMLLSVSLTAFAYTNASDWAKPYLKEADLLGLLPAKLKNADMRENITREEMCYIATLAYQALTGNSPTPNRTDYFTDTNDDMVCAAYEIGIVKGYEDGSFQPDRLLTRQEFFMIVSSLDRCVGMPVHITQDYLKKFADRGDVSSWAESAAQEAVGLGIVTGTVNSAKQTVLAPKDNTTRQEAIVMFLRCYKNAEQFMNTNWLTKDQVDQLTKKAQAEASSTEEANLVKYALSFVGSRYVYGATGPTSFDCSGFTQYVYKHFGYTINRIADDQASNGTAVSFANLQPGDLICFSHTYSSSDYITHVGIYIGGGKIVHAANSKRGVTVDTITSGYYRSHYACARRILTKK